MPSLRQTVDSLVKDGDDHVIEAPEQWAQGRTLYGGMTAALLYNAVKCAQGDLAPLRSAQFTFVGPASGRLRLRANVLRRGRFSAIVNADCRNDGGLAARSTFVFGGARLSQVTHDFTPKVDVPPPEACEPFHKTTKPLAGYLANFEFRLASGARVFERDERPEFAVWTRFRDDDGGDPVTALLAMADALPCAAMVSFAKPAALSTITWSVDLHRPFARIDGWHLLWSASESAADGYSLQNMRVYDRLGAPLASGRQVVAIFI